MQPPPSQQRAALAGPLSHLTVIDLCAARAGPSCVRILADLGANVIQVTRPDGGFSQSLPDFDLANLHRNKRSLALDLQKEEGREVFFRLVRQADVVVENYRPDVKHRLGIDYEKVSAVNERIVYGSISGFGQDGPYAGRPGVDQIVQGLSGLMSITGPPGSGPWRVGIAVSDLFAGTFLANGILAALFEREYSGLGQWVQTSLLEVLIAMLDFQATRWLIGGEVPGQAGNDHPTLFPMGVFETADGLVNIAANSERMWRDFVKVVGLPELGEDERFQTPAGRGRNRKALRAACEGVLRGRTSVEWIEAFNDAGIPCGPILTIDQVFDDPQVVHENMVAELETGENGSVRLLRSPLTLSRTPASIRRPAPRPGENSRELLAEYGLTELEIQALITKGVVTE
jgi:crotonobetainyl-CoA:carnitine CoA-transferase CaiB-like acyl-CoA transferase